MVNYLLLLAACLCACCVILSFRSVQSKRIGRIRLLCWCLTVLSVAAATVLMIIFQILSKFEYQYVYSHTSRDLALIYKISSLWSGQEGSFLLWAFILGIMGFWVLRMKSEGSNRVFGIYASISFCIFLMCFVVQPFKKMASIPADGLGLNEALKDPWMVVHPPLVFIAYSAMAILFSLSATVSPNSSTDDSARILTWMRMGWFFLGLGILSGSIWAYRALGWGGYWSWDPIENAALVPWLVLCGFLHQKQHNKRSACLLPFSLACFGVFLARSGILKDQSVHAYAGGSAILTWIILCFVFGVILFLVLSKVRKNQRAEKRSDFFKSYNWPMIYSINIYAALIFIGTVAPIVIKIETPAVYYTAVSIAFALTYSALLLVWDAQWLKKRNILMMAVSTVLVIGIMVLTGSLMFWWLLLIWVCLMPFSLWLVSGFKTNSWKYYLPHLGVVLLMVGAIASSALGKESFAIINQGGDIVIAGIRIPMLVLAEKGMLIKTLPAADIVIQWPQMAPFIQGATLIPYTTKPLIMLFWVGGFAILAHPLIVIMLDRFLAAAKFRRKS